MRLDGIHVALRQRTPWEAADLGVALVRQHAGLIARTWLLFGVPLFVLLNAVGYALDLLWLAAVLLWWLKPWFDQLVLHILSRAVFTTPPQPRETLRQQFRIKAVLPWLLWRRIDLTRSVSMPVALLEGLRGGERSARSAILGRASTSSVAMGLCVVLLHVEVAIWLSVFALALMFVPVNFLSESARVMYEVLLEDPPRWAQVLVNGVGFLAISVVEPIFVGAGFALYLNRRTQLEAWDIELAFRRIAQRLAALVVVFALVPLAGFAAPAHASAEEADAGDEWSAEVIESRALKDVFAEHKHDPKFSAEIEKTLQAGEFGEKRTLSRWELINPKSEKAEDRGDNAFLRLLSAIFGFIAKFGLWILLAALIVFIIVRFADWRLPLIERLLGPRKPPAQRVEADREPEALPGDLLGVAQALFARGAVREAMALLYRGACAAAPARLGQPLPPGATESDVVRLARDIEDGQFSAAIIDVVRQWQRAAYAADLPDASRFQALTARYAAAGLDAP